MEAASAGSIFVFEAILMCSSGSLFAPPNQS